MSGSLTHSPAQIIAQILVDLGLGTDPDDEDDWPIYAVSLPDTPDNAMCIYDTQGTMDGSSMIDGEVQEHHGFMVRIRATSHSVGQAKANAVVQGLDKSVRNEVVTLDSSTYLVTQTGRMSGPLNNGPEPTSSRIIFTVNAVAALRQTT